MTARIVSSVEAAPARPRASLKIGRRLQQIQHAPRIAIGGGQQAARARRRSICSVSRPKPRSGSPRARSSSLPKSSGGERLEHIHARARQQRVVHFEGRILRRRADENQRAVLDIGQKRILLRFVEAVHLVEEQHRVARAAQAARLLDHRTDVLDARKHRRQRDELGMGAGRHQARQRRLAGSRRPPQDHRMRPAGLQRAAQRRARTEQMRLPDVFVERSAGAAGRPAVGRCRRRPRSLAVASDHIDPRRRREREQIRRELGIALSGA